MVKVRHGKRKEGGATLCSPVEMMKESVIGLPKQCIQGRMDRSTHAIDTAPCCPSRGINRQSGYSSTG